MSPYDQFDWNRPFVPQVGLAYVRGCEVEGMLDEEGRVIEEGPEPKPHLPGKSRTFRVWLDTNQYQLDMADVVQGKEDVYETFNIFMRRKPKENNFKVKTSYSVTIVSTNSVSYVRNLYIRRQTSVNLDRSNILYLREWTGRDSVSFLSLPRLFWRRFVI